MPAIKEMALQAAADTEKEMKDCAAWFYLRHMQSTEQKLSVRANSLLTPSERAAIPASQRESEKAALHGPCTRLALLEAQLCDTITAYTKRFAMADDQIPEPIRRRMNDRLDLFAAQMQDKFHAALSACFRQNSTADQTAAALAGVFVKAAASLSTDVETGYTKANWYKLLHACAENGCEAFRFEARLTDGACGACSSQRGKTYSLEQLVAYDLLPPLHPNCRCMLVPATGQPGLLPEETGAPAWYDPLLRIPSDALVLLSGFAAAQQERLGRGTVSGFLDWLTMGVVSGFIGGLSARTDTLLEQPSLYHFANWLTLGAADLIKGAVDPDEPLSLEHWLNSLGVVSVAYGAYALGKNALANYQQAAELETMAQNKGIAATNAYSPPTGGGGITATICTNGKTIHFGHGARHLEGTGLKTDTVNRILAEEASRMHLGIGKFYKGQITIDGIVIEYTSFGMKDGSINIGTYYPLP